MKNTKYQRRFYRDWIKVKDLYLSRIIDKEIDLQILTDKELAKDFIKEKVGFYRRKIESYIAKDKRFLTSLKPIAVELNAPLIIRRMSKESSIANVGPMAAVAGAIAEFIGRGLLRRGCKEVIIENGGDIFLKTKKPRIVGIYSGKSKIWKGLSLKIRPNDSPLGICTSSGTVGHSLSFGYADSVVILAKNAILADAVATAACNRVRKKADLAKALDFAKSIKGVLGVAIIFKKHLLAWGKVEFCK